AWLWRSEEPAPAAGPSPAPRVEFAGCAAVTSGPVCVLAEARHLRLWVELAGGVPLRVLAGGSHLPAEEKEVRGGRVLTFTVPAGAREVVVEAPGRSPWRLPVREDEAAPLLKRAAAERAEGRGEEAARLLREEARSLPEAGRARARSLLARIELSQGRSEAAVTLLREAMALHRSTGQRSDEFLDALALAYTLIHHGRDFAEARTVLEGLGPLARDYPEGHAQLPYYQGLLAIESGDVRTALRRFAEAEPRAERLGLERLLRAVRQVVATTLLQLGRDEEALTLLESLREGLSAEDHPCELADLLTNLGWGRVLAGESGGGVAQGDPGPPLEEALALYRGACASPDDEANVLLNLAQADLMAGRADSAGSRLEAARRVRAHPGARLALWWLDVEGRIHLEAGRAREALRSYARLAELAEASASPEARWRAALGRGRAAEQLGDARGALAAHAEAEALLDDEVLRIPVLEGRHLFLREREHSSRAYVAIAVREGRFSEALEVARRARVRVLEAVRLSDRVARLPAPERTRWEEALSAWRDAREALDGEAAEDWRLSAKRLAEVRQARRRQEERLRVLLEEALVLLEPSHAEQGGHRPLSAPGPDELQLTYYPAPRGWVGFAADAHSVEARFLEPVTPDAPPERLAATLLEPFRERIASAGRLTFIPYGVLRAVDFHALPFHGDVLVAGRPVAYALDLPRPAPVDAREGGPTALVVADPQGNLPQAREEARLVREALHGKWRVREQSGAAAEGAAVREALEQVELFHYAGHGRFAGLGGWESALPLYGSQLTVGDVLALRKAPAWVVLSGCETARGAQESPVESMGLAQAFLAAGAHGVVAARRVVADADAFALMRELYRQGGPTSLPESLRRAQLQLRDSRPDSDWAAFRALVP
ncbi:MAG TPA: CHAT domain-containing protein, partial [Myxococcaceae bacterium]|nr:CHAT domain-containing protein [Myxococcaceae bacterium]